MDGDPHRAAPRGVGEIIVSSRSYDEYRAMFGLTDDELLAGPVLDCPGGAGAFGAGLRARGGTAVSVDPAYALAPAALVGRVRVGLERALAYLAGNRDAYVWSYFSSPSELRRRRGDALAVFAGDFAGPDDRYVVAALPRLPFPDGAFRLALTGYLLFAYPDHLDHAQHLAALRELARVAREEVRAFPLLDTAFVRTAWLDGLRRALVREGVDSEVRRVAYELQRGGDEVLVLRPPPAPLSGPAPERRAT